MKVVSDALYEAIHKRNRKFKLRLDFGEFQITNAENYKTELISSPSSGLAVGCVAIGSGSFEIKNNVVDVSNKVFRAYIGMEIQGQMEWIKLGKYTVKNIEKKGTKDVVSFEDDISLLDVRFDEALTLPTSATAVLQRIETICGVKFDFNSFDIFTVIDKQLEGYSCRDIVGWIAQLMGLFVVVDNQTEQISAKWYVDSGYVINDTNYLYMIDEPTTDAHFRLDAISCQTGLETLVASNENAVGVMSISNPLMTQSRLDVIFSERKNFEYDEGELSFLLGNPLFDPWDIITVEYRGKTSVFPVMSLSFAFNGGFTTKVKTFVRDEDTAFEGNITKQIADVKTKVTVLDGYVATEVVKNGEVVTAINASDEEVTIKADKINLVGLIENIFTQKITSPNNPNVYFDLANGEVSASELISPDGETELSIYRPDGLANAVLINDEGETRFRFQPNSGHPYIGAYDSSGSEVNLHLQNNRLLFRVIKPTSEYTGLEIDAGSNSVWLLENGVGHVHFGEKSFRFKAGDTTLNGLSSGSITIGNTDGYYMMFEPDGITSNFRLWSSESPKMLMADSDGNIVRSKVSPDDLATLVKQALGTTLYEVDPKTTNGIYANGKETADSVNSATLTDPTKKYKRLKIYARFPGATQVQEFDLSTPSQTVNALFGDRMGSIFTFAGDVADSNATGGVNGANRHYFYKINFCVKEMTSGWRFQITDAGYLIPGIPVLTPDQFHNGGDLSINGTSYGSYQQRHNSSYCIYKIVGYED